MEMYLSAPGNVGSDAHASPRVKITWCFQLLGDDDEGDAVFAGDCLMNGSTAEFEDLSAYSRSLRKLLLKRSRSPTRLVAENQV